MLDLTTPLSNAIDLIWNMFASEIILPDGTTELGIVTLGNAPWNYTSADQGAKIEASPELYADKDTNIKENDVITNLGNKYLVGPITLVQLPSGDKIVASAPLEKTL